MSNHRNAALALHALHPADQRWVLDKLCASDRDTLRGYLRELRDLGIPAGTEAPLSPALAPQPEASRPGTPARPTLRSASAAEVAQALVGEPPWLVSHLLDLYDWAWKSAFLAAMPPPARKLLIHACMPPLAERTARALVSGVEARLAPVADQPGLALAPAPKHRVVLSTVRGAVRRWF